MKIAFYNPFMDPHDFREALKPFEDVEFAVAKTEDDIPRAVTGAEILLVANRTYTDIPARHYRDYGKDLRWIAFTTSGFDKAEANGLPGGVTVTNMAGLRAFAVAEHAFFLMLSLLRASRASEKAQQAGEWSRIPLTPLMDNAAGKHLVIIGTGAIAQDFARKAKAFDMRITGISRRTGALDNFDALRPREELAAAAAQADVLLVAALAADDTFGIVSRNVIDAMQPHSYLVNIARGSLVDEPALIEALRAGRLAGAGLDVQAQEPTPPDHPLWSLDNVIVTPHVAGAGADFPGLSHASLFIANFKRWRAGQELDKIVART
ncbi:MAG: D-2-hydroxyacid dehydrogenase [Hyphomicrobiales bacterium]|nr:D-2-hydroxyacid dehydrogenase [Hyphomicrobiales bacterium]